MAMCVTAVVGTAPCQCFSPGGIQITSPGRISSIGPPKRCARPQPAVTIRVWPSGWVCHAVRAPGSKVTLAPDVRAGAFGWNKGSMRTVPVNQSSGPLTDGCEPILLISILTCWVWGEGASTWASRIAGVASAAPVVFRKLRRDRAITYEFQIMDSLGNLGRAKLTGDLLPRAC